MNVFTIIIFIIQCVYCKIASKIKCGPPPKMQNTLIDNNFDGRADFSIGSTVPYSCSDGYYRADRGMPMAKCMLVNATARWFGPDIDCIARVCVNPGTITNGRQDGDDFIYRSTVRYYCNEGYELEGSAVRKCQADGSWSGTEPKCKPIHCPRPPDPVHGQVSGQSLDYLAKVTYSCSDGFRLAGQTSRTCQADKTWSGYHPKCEEIQCQTLTYLENGYITGSETNYKAVVMFYCNLDAFRVGENFATCNKDGNWTNPLPKCLSACRIPNVKHGEIRNMQSSGKVIHGQILELVCYENYELSEPDFPRCFNGTWSYEPKCLPIKCEKWPPEIKNGYVAFLSTDHGSVAKYVCKSGFGLSGPEIVTCNFGSWGNITTSCNEIYCPHPNDVGITLNNGRIKLEGSMGTYEYEKYIQNIGEYRNIIFECSKGYVLQGPRRATCVNGTWEPANVVRKCSEQSHAPMEEVEWQLMPTVTQKVSSRRKRLVPEDSCHPLLPDNKRFFANIRLNPDEVSGKFPPASSVLVQCRSGFRLKNPENSHVTCYDRLWIPKPSGCIPKSCKLPAVGNGFFSYRDDILNFDSEIPHGRSVKTHCNRGYQLYGRNTVECTLGQWLKPVATCLPKKCKIPKLEDGTYETADEESSLQLLDNNAKIRFICLNKKIPLPKSDDNHRFGEISCQFGRILPRNPECLDASGKKPPYAQKSKSACLRPGDIQSAWVYVKMSDTESILIDPFARFFANNTVIHYKCLSDQDSDRQHEASAIVCNSGEWQALLGPCAPKKVLPSTVKTNDSTLLLIQINDNRRPCKKLTFDQNKILINTGRKQVFYAKDKITVQCKFAATRKWTLECQNGEWAHLQHVDCSNTVDPKIPVGRSTSCMFDPGRFKNTNVYNVNRGEIMKFKEELPESTTLLFRCVHVGLMKLSGARSSQCLAGRWTGSVPNCKVLLPPNFTPSTKEPAILYRAINSTVQQRVPLAQAMSGNILAPKSLDIELDCIFPDTVAKSHESLENKLRWEYSSTYRQYPQTWINVSLSDYPDIMEDNNIEVYNENYQNADLMAFRLQLISVQVEDSGIFTCIAISGQRHSITLAVSHYECPKLTLSKNGLKFEPNRLYNSIGSVVHFYCETGKMIEGPAKLYCLENGQWSNNLPSCKSITCPQVSSLLVVNSTNVEFGTFLRMSCLPGYKLIGSKTVYCNESARWEPSLPKCVKTHCSRPILEHSRTKMKPEKRHYLTGEVVNFFCDFWDESQINFTTRQNRYSSACTENGNWSKSVLDCDSKCEKPSLKSNVGIFGVEKSTYDVGYRIVFYCKPPRLYTLEGRSVIECDESGRWSHEAPICRMK